MEVIDGDHIKLYGNAPSEITVRHKSGVIENYRVSFKDSTETVLAFKSYNSLRRCHHQIVEAAHILLITSGAQRFTV